MIDQQMHVLCNAMSNNGNPAPVPLCFHVRSSRCLGRA
ncbi:hypothetical protein M7I_5153 [Glarea lozoyensis 74030]|uniref:Uncharacterized protein n=1 Tax=Glarea lozoyensis (strain ATCC 74030 / MF5533) TaxID=1104152 RepID=H0ER38_GLAL7|nr:hypothetical protein M7I_5153 [Glarea lozoyensis 74030]